MKINKIYLEDTMVKNYIFDSIGILLVFALCSVLFSIASVNIISVSLCQRPLRRIPCVMVSCRGLPCPSIPGSVVVTPRALASPWEPRRPAALGLVIIAPCLFQV